MCATRTFIAINIPDGIKTKLKEIAKDIPVKSRLVSKNNMHITLFFLGNIDDKTLEHKKKLLEELDYNKFELSINGIGAFVTSGHAVVYAKIGKGADELIGIYDALFDGMHNLPLRLDKRKFAPHITVGRIRVLKSKTVLSNFISENSDKEFGSFLCSSIKIKKSILDANVAVHSNIYSKELL